MGQLNWLFGSRGVVSFCPFEADEPTVNLMATLFEGRETALPSITESYEAYFEGRSIAYTPNLPPSLQRLMDLLHHSVAFSNGGWETTCYGIALPLLRHRGTLGCVEQHHQ